MHPKISAHGSFCIATTIRRITALIEMCACQSYRETEGALTTNDTRWGAYEAIQADIFGHPIAMARVFEIEIHPSPAYSPGDEIPVASRGPGVEVRRVKRGTSQA